MTIAGHPEKACYGLLAAGVLLFAAGLFAGFEKHAGPVLVYGLLGLATLAFALVVLMILKPVTGPHPEAPAEPPMDTVHDPAADPVMAQRPVEPAVAAPAAPAAPVVARAPGTVINLGLGTTLGEVLLQAIRADPEGAVRLLAGVISK